MDQQTAQKPIESTSLELKDFEPVNEYLLCRKIALPEKTSGGIILPETVKDIWGGRGEVVAASKTLIPQLNEYKVGQVILYPRRAMTMDLWVDEEQLFLIHKRDVAAIVKK